MSQYAEDFTAEPIRNGVVEDDPLEVDVALAFDFEDDEDFVDVEPDDGSSFGFGAFRSCPRTTVPSFFV